MNSKPLVSIMISYYNDNEYLRENIQSILSQTYQNWELILLNHASTDNSREIAHSFKDDRIRHIDYPVNLGAMSGELYYEMLKLAKGEYVKFYSADDKLKPDGIENLVNFMEEHKEYGFAFGNVEYMDSNSQSLNDTWFEARPGFSFDYTQDELLKKYFDICSIFPFAGHIIRRTALSKLNFSNCFILLFDVYLWFSLMADGNKLGLINKVVANYRIHEGQLTSLSKRDIYNIRGYIEFEYYRELLFRIKNPDLIKLLCSDSQYVNKVENETDAEFVLADYLFSNYSSIAAYSKLSQLLNDERTMLYLREKFGYTIGDLRAKQYSKTFLPPPQPVLNWRKKARCIGENLDNKQLLWLLLYRLTRNPFKKKNKDNSPDQKQVKSREYSL